MALGNTGWKLCSNINVDWMDVNGTMALNGCWEKLWLEAVCDFSEQQEEMDFLVLTSDISEEGSQVM